MTPVSRNDLSAANINSPRAASSSLQTMEGKDLMLNARRASRASNRLSGLSFKRKSSRPLTISAPTDFRNVESFSQCFSSEQFQFQPLELNIHRPGNRLSDLPTFESFQPGNESSLRLPPRALSMSYDISRSLEYYCPDHFRVPRKPVGSGPRRASVASPLELSLEKRASISATSPLIPHFSTLVSQRISVFGDAFALLPQTASTELELDGRRGHEQALKNDQYSNIARAKLSVNLQGRSSNPTTPPGRFSSTIASPVVAERVHTPPSPKTPCPSPFAKWLSTSEDSSIPLMTTKESIDYPNHDRLRTLSGSTLSPSLTEGIEAVRSRGSTTAVQATLLEAHAEKTVELMDIWPHPLPLISRRDFSSISDEPVHPTMHKGKQQEGYSYSHNSYASHRESPIGLAF
ncbi:hypothetical protein MPDQ_003424 [Monascus purpureus]|uniref:Uncharacterized protein n=1 Tax=Monascus purpureus TaxID=5098 RepID=A0A507QMW1_MONPU|nr:hypothetical protein MPDQ_003424 [Monascus purpureus]